MRAKGHAESKVEDVKESQLRFKKPTTEEMRLAQLLDDKQQDDERETIILQVMETTSRLRDDVIIALHDCNYDPNRAIEVLMDHDDLTKEEWQECGIAKRKKKVTAADEVPAENATDEGFQNVGENPQNNISNAQRPGNRRSYGEKGTADNRDNSKPRERRPNRGRGDDRRSRTVGERHPLSGSNNENGFDWQQNESEGSGHVMNQKPHQNRRNYEPGAEEPANEAPIGVPRRGGRGGMSARGRSWYGGRNGGHDSGRGGPDGVGRGRHPDRQTGGQSENANANSFTVGTWENSEYGKQSGGGHGGAADWDIDEWDGSLTKTQVFERSSAQEKVSYGAIGAKPGSMQPLHVEETGNSGPPSAHSPNAGPIRVSLDNVMNVAASRRQDEPLATSKSPRRPEAQEKQKPPTPQRQEKPTGQACAQPQRSQQKSSQPTEPPVVILDNRRHVMDPHGNSSTVGLRFGSGLDSIGITVGGANGGLSGAAEKQPGIQSATVQPIVTPSQTQRQAFSSSPYRQNEPPQTSPTKQSSSQSSQPELGGAIPQQASRGLPPQQSQQLGVATSRPQSQPQQHAGGFQQQQQQSEQFSAGNFRPSSSGGSKPPAGLDPSIAQVRNSAQSPYQQAKVNGDQQQQNFGVQSQSLGRPPQQVQPQPTATSASIPPLLLHPSAAAPVYTGASSSSSNAFSASSATTSTKLTESMTKLSVQDVVKSPQRNQQQQPPQPVPTSQQIPPQTAQQPQNPVTSAAGFDQNMLKFAVPPPPPAYAMPPPAAGTMPYYFPQYPANQQNSNQQQAQQQGQQPQTSVSGSVGDYFNTPDVAALYQRTLLEQQHGPQQGHGQQGGQAASPMMKPPNQPQDNRIAPEQLLGIPTAPHGQNQGAGNAASLPPHSSAAGMPPPFLTPQLFYPLMQLFAANPTLMAPFLASQVPPAPPPTADLKSQAQFLQAVGMSPFLHYAQQQQQATSSQHIGDDISGVAGQHQSQQSLVVGHQGQGNVDSNVVGQQHQQSHQPHVSQQQSIRPPPGFLMPVRQSSSGMNMPPSNNNDVNMSGFRAFQQHQTQQQSDKGQSNAGGPPGLFGPGPAGPSQQAYLAGAQPRQAPQQGVIKPQPSHMNPYWNPNS